MTIRFRCFQTRASRSLVTALVVAALFFFAICRLENGVSIDRSRTSPRPATKLDPTSKQLGDCPDSPIRHLAKPELKLTDKITYSKRCIKPVVSSSVDRNVIANISESFFHTSTDLDLTSCAPVHLDKCDPLPLHVHNAYPQNTYSHISFGVSTSYDRFIDSLGPFAFWLAGSRAKFIGVVSDWEKHPDFGPLESLFQEAGIDAKFIKPADPKLSVSQNHFTVIRELLEEAGSEAQWIGLLDDDTFFPSLYRLSEALAQFDHTQHAYVGALSEDFRAVRGFGYMGFGGAGVFLSVALARHLEPLIETCLAEAKHMEGDALIRDCTYHHTKAKLTMLPGLQQMDISQDASGFYEGGPDPLSLHHWKSWYQAPVATMSTVTQVCGDCFLQRWRMGEDTVFSNGYSIAVYRDGTKHLDLSNMESTWNPGDGAYDYSIGPLRAKLPPDEKKQYKLEAAEFLDNGQLRQLYIYKSHASGVNDEVVELIWEPSKAGVLLNRPS